MKGNYLSQIFFFFLTTLSTKCLPPEPLKLESKLDSFCVIRNAQYMKQNEIPESATQKYLKDGLEVFEVLGTGAFGSVRRAIFNGQYVALKIMNIIDSNIDEINYMIKLNRTQGIPEIYACEMGAETLYIVQELLYEDLSKNKGLKIMKNIDFIDRIDLYIGFLNTLNELQKMEIVHRDIKPENMMLKSRNGERIYLIDLGATTHKSIRLIGGTTAFISPRMSKKDSPNDLKDDTYSALLSLAEIEYGRTSIPQGHEDCVKKGFDRSCFDLLIEGVDNAASKKFYFQELDCGEIVPKKILNLIKYGLEYEEDKRWHLPEIIQDMEKLKSECGEFLKRSKKQSSGSEKIKPSKADTNNLIVVPTKENKILPELDTYHLISVPKEENKIFPESNTDHLISVPNKDDKILTELDIRRDDLNIMGDAEEIEKNIMDLLSKLKTSLDQNIKDQKRAEERLAQAAPIHPNYLKLNAKKLDNAVLPSIILPENFKIEEMSRPLPIIQIKEEKENIPKKAGKYGFDAISKGTFESSEENKNAKGIPTVNYFDMNDHKSNSENHEDRKDESVRSHGEELNNKIDPVNETVTKMNRNYFALNLKRQSTTVQNVGKTSLSFDYIVNEQKVPRPVIDREENDQYSTDYINFPQTKPNFLNDKSVPYTSNKLTSIHTIRPSPNIIKKQIEQSLDNKNKDRIQSIGDNKEPEIRSNYKSVDSKKQQLEMPIRMEKINHHVLPPKDKKKVIIPVQSKVGNKLEVISNQNQQAIQGDNLEGGIVRAEKPVTRKLRLSFQKLI
jgi:serine/threonine protein kinase